MLRSSAGKREFIYDQRTNESPVTHHDLKVCIRRESKRQNQSSPKDIYTKSKKKAAIVPGVNVPYEEPKAPGIVVDTARLDIDQAVQKIVKGMGKLFL